MLGPCYGMGTWYAVQSDFTSVRRDAAFSVSSPKVVSVALSQEVSPEELGGADVHAEITGFADHVGETDADCIAALRRFLSYLPSHAQEAPPLGASPWRPTMARGSPR